jgi:hypothetical protein
VFSNPTPDEAPRGAFAGDAALPSRSAGRVIVALVRSERHALLRSALSRCAPGWRLHLSSSAFDATFRLVNTCADLLVVDLHGWPDEPLALIHALARCAPTARVLALTDDAAGGSIQPYVAQPWHDADRALLGAVRAIERRCGGVGSAR